MGSEMGNRRKCWDRNRENGGEEKQQNGGECRDSGIKCGYSIRGIRDGGNRSRECDRAGEVVSGLGGEGKRMEGGERILKGGGGMRRKEVEILITWRITVVERGEED